MSALHLVLGLVVLQRAAELIHARRNTRRLLAAGAVEVGAGHYPVLVAVHAAWLLALLVAVPAAAPINGFWLAFFLALQAARLWVQLSLGRLWTTRIITLPGLPLVRRGPYRYLDHPNYLVVAAEIPVLPLVFGAWEIALGFGLLNLGLVIHRARVENRALAPRRKLARET